jgi:hypothetical protein
MLIISLKPQLFDIVPHTIYDLLEDAHYDQQADSGKKLNWPPCIAHRLGMASNQAAAFSRTNGRLSGHAIAPSNEGPWNPWQ